MTSETGYSFGVARLESLERLADRYHGTSAAYENCGGRTYHRTRAQRLARYNSLAAWSSDKVALQHGAGGADLG
jgi:hypothetical protein